MIVSEEDIFLFMMVFLRVSALLLLIPFFIGKLAPKHLRLVMGVAMAVLIYPTFPSGIAMPDSLAAYIGISIKEILVGLLMGFAVKMIFFSVEFAGHIISTEVGLMMSHSFDPSDSNTSTTISSTLFYLTVLIFFATGTHHAILISFIKSFQYIPISTPLFSLKGGEALLKASNHVFILGLQISAPIIAINFIINMTFAILGKAAPKINVFMISFGVRILAGFSLLLMALHLIAQYIYQNVEKTPTLMLEILSY